MEKGQASPPGSTQMFLNLPRSIRPDSFHYENDNMKTKLVTVVSAVAMGWLL